LKVEEFGRERGQYRRECGMRRREISPRSLHSAAAKNAAAPVGLTA